MALNFPFFRRPAPALPPGERIYAIGDIHGCSALFDSLKQSVRADNAARGEAHTTVILLGDLVDRGPDSAGMIERAMHWNEDWAGLEVLRGNHEASFAAVLGGEKQWLASWIVYGGVETLQSYGLSPHKLAAMTDDEIVAAARAAVPAPSREWIADLPLQRRHGDYLFVHAGIKPGVPIDEQQAQDLLWIREEFLDSRANHGAMVVHGHSIREEIDQRSNRIGIDTGAFATGRLTAMGIEGEERWFLQT